MLKVLASLQLFSAASRASADQVLVLGSAPTPLYHESSSSAFSAAGLAELALNSLGVATGSVASRPAAQSPLQADIFMHAEAYALLILDDASAAAVNTVDAALSASPGFHKTFEASSASVKVPVAVAQEIQASYSNSVRCAGSASLCASVKAWTPPVNAELVQEVLSRNTFLQSSDQQDVAFAKELAQVAQLTAKLKEDGGDKTLYIVGLSTPKLDGKQKQQLATQAVATSVAEFLGQLVKTRSVVGAQVMTGKLPMSVQQVAALSRRARNRRLMASLTRTKDDVDDEDEDEDVVDEEEEVEDLAAESGSASEEDDNVTTTTNSTASPIKMPDIAEFQIILWTSVLLGAILVMAVLAMGNMNTGRDSLLYAKFIADVNGRKTN